METEIKRDKSIQKMNDIIEELERDSFIGRQREIEKFKNFISLTDQHARVLHIYGPGGIGKSFLLGEYARFAEDKGILFLGMDSRDYPHTPTGFSEQILTL